MRAMLHRSRRLCPIFSSCSVHRPEDGCRDPFQLEIGGKASVSSISDDRLYLISRRPPFTERPSADTARAGRGLDAQRASASVMAGA
jgi:hypothetical protein